MDYIDEYANGQADLAKSFAYWVGLLKPIFQHDDSYPNEQDQIRAVFDYFEVPKFWRGPVRGLARGIAQGNAYYGLEAWYDRYVP